MTLQMNETSLMVNGYKNVSNYKRFDKDINGNWKCYTSNCWQKDNHCIIFLKSPYRRRSFVLEYTNKSYANAKIKELLTMGYKLDRKGN